MEEQQRIATCLICKHALVAKLNIFKTRTKFSKTLVSSKLSKLVQSTFRQEAMSDTQDICSSCSSLINQVDECEIKLMALENEVKLKYKMPFPIEVHSRRSDSAAPPPPALPTPAAEAPSTGSPSTEGVPVHVAPSSEHTRNHDPPEGEQFSYISIDGGALDSQTIVLEAGDVNIEESNVVVYREPYGDEPLSYDTSMSYLAQLEAAEMHPEDDDVTGHHFMSPSSDARNHRPPAKRHRSSREGDGVSLLACDLCDDTFTTMNSLRTHRICHSNGRSFACHFCNRVFSSNIALHHHWNEEHPSKLKPCPHCDKRFINKSNLNQHINTHKEPRFSCEWEQCGRQFHTRGDLRKHITFKHSNEKNFQCPDCELSFKANWLLTRHKVRVHT